MLDLHDVLSAVALQAARDACKSVLSPEEYEAESAKVQAMLTKVQKLAGLDDRMDVVRVTIHHMVTNKGLDLDSVEVGLVMAGGADWLGVRSK